MSKKEKTKEKSNDALDIVFLQIEIFKEALLKLLNEKDVEEDVIFDIIEMFYEYLKI